MNPILAGAIKILVSIMAILLFALNTAPVVLADATASCNAGTGTNSTECGVNSDTGTGNTTTAVGNGATATDSDATALGENTSATGTGSTALGADSVASATRSHALGRKSDATATSALAVGANAQASALHSVAIGGGAGTTTSARASGVNSIAIGGGASGQVGAEATGTTAIAIGNSALAGHSNAIAIGAGATTSGADQIVLGAADRFIVSGTDDIGLGIASPVAALHLKRSDSTALILVEEADIVQGPRTLFEIKNKGNPEFRMTNSGNSNSWLFSAGLRFVVKNNAGDWVSRIDAAGDMEITGELTTTGTICGLGGCDMVFHPDTEIESIEEHAAQMWENSYLPSVGPTVENAPFNLTKKTGGILNELEKAHIYIEQLHTRNLSLERRSEEHQQHSREMESRIHELEQQNQRIEELVMRMVMGQAESVAMD